METNSSSFKQRIGSAAALSPRGDFTLARGLTQHVGPVEWGFVEANSCSPLVKGFVWGPEMQSRCDNAGPLIKGIRIVGR